MRFLKSSFGFCITGIIINSYWSIFTNKLGVKGGWISSLILIGTLWTINHHFGLVENKKEAVFIDMGLAIALCSLTRDSVLTGTNGLLSSLPTFVCVSIGGILAGIIGGYIQKIKNNNFIMK
ncbi:MAG: hypothetical protein PHX70_14530 [Clostridium sp.]|nr:hypothetical protein [Clostridium sp.]